MMKAIIDEPGELTSGYYEIIDENIPNIKSKYKMIWTDGNNMTGESYYWFKDCNPPYGCTKRLCLGHIDSRYVCLNYDLRLCEICSWIYCDENPNDYCTKH